jgi:hypothetical protein
MTPDDEYRLETLRNSAACIAVDHEVSKAINASNAYLSSQDALEQASRALAEQLARSKTHVSASEGSPGPTDGASVRNKVWAAHISAAKDLLAASSPHVHAAMARLKTDLSIQELSKFKDAIGSLHGGTEASDAG